MESQRAEHNIGYILVGMILCGLLCATSMSLAAYEVVLDGRHSFWTEYTDIQLKEGDIVVFDAEGKICWDPNVSEQYQVKRCHTHTPGCCWTGCASSAGFTDHFKPWGDIRITR